MNRLKDFCDGSRERPDEYCKYIKLAIIRFEDDIERDDIVYRTDLVQQCISFIESCPLWTNPGRLVKLLPWQIFIIANLVGLYRTSGIRKYRYALMLCARKSGKTAFAALLVLYFLLLDEAESEDGFKARGKQNFLIANSFQQAELCYSHIRGFSKAIDPKEQVLKAWKKQLNMDSTESHVKVLANNHMKMDGLHPLISVIDEFAADETNGAMFDVIKSGTLGHKSPLTMMITTAHFSRQTRCYEMRETCIDILEGRSKDDAMFAALFELDDPEKEWTMPERWIKSNPSIGLIAKMDDLMIEFEQAKNDSSARLNFLTKNLNCFVDSASAYIKSEDWDSCGDSELKIEDFAGKPCFVGTDLSSKEDFTALSYVFLDDETDILSGFTSFTYLFIPHYSLNKRKKFIQNWAAEGHIITTPGNVVDHAVVRNKILELMDLGVTPRTIVTDPWNATQMSVELINEGLNTLQYNQSKAKFSEPTKELANSVLSHTFKHDSNPVMSWMARNCYISADADGNVKCDKSKCTEKIDGIIALQMALGQALIELKESKGSPELYFF